MGKNTVVHAHVSGAAKREATAEKNEYLALRLLLPERLRTALVAIRELSRIVEMLTSMQPPEPRDNNKPGCPNNRVGRRFRP